MKRKEKVQILVFRKKEKTDQKTKPHLPLSTHEFLILRTNRDRGSFWQPITGKVEEDELDLRAVALREVSEETGITRYERIVSLDYSFEFVKKEQKTVYTEHVFALEVTANVNVALSHEHETYLWCPFQEAREKVSFDSNKRSFDKLVETLEREEKKTSSPAQAPSVNLKEKHSLLSTTAKTPKPENGTKLNLPLVALSFSLLLVFGVGMSFFEGSSDNSFHGNVIIDFNGQNSNYLNDSYDINNGFSIFLWEMEDLNWSFEKISSGEAEEEFELELGEPEGESHIIFIFKDLEKNNASVFDLLILSTDIGGFEIDYSHSKSLDAKRVTAIAGVEDGKDGIYWQYWVDDDYATMAADWNYPEGEHTVKWVFG